MKEEISRVLKLVEEGKIDSEKAVELIEAIKSKETEPKAVSNVFINDNRMLKIRVISSSSEHGNETVNVNLPIKFIKSMSKAVNRVPGVDGIDMNEIITAIENGAEGKIVDIKSDRGDNVEVIIE